MIRVISYIDGFNLYFGLRESKMRKYLWLDVRKLCTAILKPGQELVATKYFSARISGPADKRKRQQLFLEAVETLPDTLSFFGKYQMNPQYCPACKRRTHIPNEKMTDVNIATEMLTDAFKNKFDVALLISADSDLRPPIATILREYPQKPVIVAFPPGRASKELRKVASASFPIGLDKIRKSQFPETVTKSNGFKLQRPNEWA